MSRRLSTAPPAVTRTTYAPGANALASSATSWVPASKVPAVSDTRRPSASYTTTPTRPPSTAVNVTVAASAVGFGPIPSTEKAPVAESESATTAGRAEVVASLPEAARVRVSVFDARGREVAVLHIGALADGAALEVDTSRLAPGVYVVRAVAEGASASATLTVVR